LLLMEFTSSKSMIAEGSGEAPQSPAAKYFGEKKAGGKVQKGAEGFARSLEKAQGGDGKPVSKVSEGPGKAPAKKGNNKARTVTPEILRELLGGLNEQQLIRVLMKINPKELLRYAESLGIDTTALLKLAKPADSAPVEGKWQLNRSRLVHLITQLSELLGEQTIVDTIASTVGSKRPAARQLPESDAGGRVKNREIGEARKVGKRPRVVVLDLRKDQTKGSREQPNPIKNSFSLTTEKAAEAEGRDVSVLFRAPFQDKAQTPALEASVRTARATTNFEQRFIPEVVKQTGIILKSGGNGEIRLVLKPENLGSVRIRLALSESSLEGRIVVDNNSVKELVESSLDSLRNALRMEGYQTNLEVSVGHRRNSGGNEQTQTRPVGWLAGGSEEFDKAVPLYLDMRPDYELVNVFA
jgi:hypothetical protein